ncbi:MAG: DUF58 domain-containing protein [Acidimicrobiales bacterium]
MAPEGRPRIRLTRSGRAVVVVAVLCVLASRLLGIEEMSILGLCLGAAVVCSWAALRVAGSDLDVTRTVRPRRVTVGERCSVDVTVHNGRSVLRLPLQVEDFLDGSVAASLVLSQRRRDPACQAQYGLPAGRRGIARFGPLRVTTLDPFGLARITQVVPGTVDVIVLPALVPLQLVHASGSEDPAGGARHRRQLTTVSEEFESLREYAPGDDVRRVHWASTARLGRPMVRNHQHPSQRRTTVVLDDRVDGYPPSLDDEAFERAVGAAASAMAACRAQGDLVRLITSSGIDTGAFDDQQRFDSVLDQLAALQLTRLPAAGALPGALTVATGTGDRIIAAVGLLTDPDRAALARTAAMVGNDVIVVACSGARAGTGTADAEIIRGVRTVRYAGGSDLDRQWKAAVPVRAGAMAVDA